MIVRSRSNPAIRRIRSLATRKGREQSGLFFAEGIRIVGEAVESGACIEQWVVAPDLLTSEYGHTLVEQMRDAGVPGVEVSDAVFSSISMRERPQGLAAIVQQRWERQDEIDLRAGLCWIALDEVQDPGNLGAIIRTADAVGAGGLMCLGNSTDPYDPNALRASMGAIFSQRLARASFGMVSERAREHGSMVVGTSDAAPLDYRAAVYCRPLVLLMGSERQGLSAEQQDSCDLVVSIPIVGRGDSLNLAIATGVMLYAIFDQCGKSVSR